MIKNDECKKLIIKKYTNVLKHCIDYFFIHSCTTDTMENSSVLKTLQEQIEVENDFHKIQKHIYRCHGIYFTKGQLLKIYLHHLSKGLVREDSRIEMLLRLRSTRSNSGELEVATIMPPEAMSCRYDCSMCPNETIANGATMNMARSYLSSEGTPKLGIIEHFRCRYQIWRRLIQYEYVLGHKIDKMIHIILGGTFHSYNKDTREDYIHDIYYACNVYKEYFSLRHGGKKSKQIQDWIEQKNPFQNKISFMDTFHDMCDTEIRERWSLEKEKKINTTMDYGRITGIVIETRPDEIGILSIKELRKFGVTRVQLGIQHSDTAVLSFMNRRHDFNVSKKACQKLKDNGFKIDAHALLDCPGTTFEKDIEFCNRLFKEICPDYVKIYICVDVPFTKNRQYRENGKHYSPEQALDIKKLMIENDHDGLNRFAKRMNKKLEDVYVWQPFAETDYEGFFEMLNTVIRIVPSWTRIARFHRDFPKAEDAPLRLGYESENVRTNLHQLCKEKLERLGMYSRDIRSREIRNEKICMEKCELHVYSYDCLQGKDFFMSVEQKMDNGRYNILGMIRCRITEYDESDVLKRPGHFLNVFKKKSLRVRELHVYGNLQSASNENHGQHRGIGKFLLRIAEQTASEYMMEQVVIISGVGVQEYYKKLGYQLSDKDEYMIKSVSPKETSPKKIMLGNDFYIDCNQFSSEIRKKNNPFFQSDIKKISEWSHLIYFWLAIIAMTVITVMIKKMM